MAGIPSEHPAGNPRGRLGVSHMKGREPGVYIPMLVLLSRGLLPGH